MAREVADRVCSQPARVQLDIVSKKLYTGEDDQSKVVLTGYTGDDSKHVGQLTAFALIKREI